MSPANPYFWNGSSLVGLSGAPAALDDQDYVVGTTGTTGTDGYLWSAATSSTTAISSMIPAPYITQLANITPFDISNVNSSDGSLRILFNAQYQNAPYAGASPTGPGWSSGTFVLTVTGTQATPAQVNLPSNVSFSWNQARMVNSQGQIGGIGNITSGTGSATVTGTNHAPLLLPVEFTGTDSNPNVDNGTYPGFPSGFDGYTQPNWLSVPENASNSAKAYTPASSTTTIAFTGTTQDPYMWITASPSSTTSSPQTVTANVGYMSGVFSSQIAVGMGAQVATGGRLNLDVKQYQLKTVAMSVIAQQSGTNPIIYPANPPTAATLQAYLNQVYGPQTNTYFTVVQYNYATNFDPTNTGTVVIDSTPGSPGGPETTAIRKVARNASFDFNIYYVPSLQGPGSSTGWSFPNLYHDTFVGCNSGAYTKLISAHEIGHLFGLHHPQDPGPQNDPTAPSYDLMQHFVSGEFLDHLQWDIVNPYTPNRL